MNIRHTPPRPRLILYKALALSSLVLAAMLFCAPAARAGSWVFICTGSGINTMTNAFGHSQYTPWTPPGPETGQFGFSQFGSSSDYSTSSSTTMTATVTATWKPDGGEDDTPPPEVWLCESASAEWMYESSGSADDGFGDAAVSNSDGSLGGTSFTATSNPPPPPYIPAPPPHWKKYTVSGKSVTLPTRTLKAESDFVPTPARSYGDNCYAFVNGYNVTVHPQPYNMRLTPNPDGTPAVYVDNINGRLLFHYSISSTDGKAADMNSVTAYETLDWGSSNPGAYQGGYYAPPSPPVAPYLDGARYAYNTPQKIVFPYLLQGYVLDGFSPPTTGFVSPYPAPSTVWSATQNYLFDDSATQETGTVIPGPDNKSPFTITRSVRPTNAAGTTRMYAISAHGSSALKSLP